ncbi:MAG: PQQ-like beta-propeller repeat protein [Planctomycetes bacterium]|nr:PQQ-like beta-propeller repeat protein [Planctomycetota bacterium]MCH9775494.1 PQQ-like beta-propeller repeat protein [Planctomycetota bacterium]MCH9790720.1 PQQ-like beta-propeller repeat protein [Planctomycetota bacterium]
MKFCLQLLTFSLSVVFCTSTILAEDWPAFRGPRGNGTSLEKKVPLKWSPTENIIWKVALPAPGNSSPIVSNGRVFVTCAEDEGRKRSLYCFDRTNGRELWKRTVNFDKVMPTHKTNNYCGSTPVADGKRVVVWHASAGLFCYDFAGKELWNRNLGEFEHIWGYGASPILHKGKIILHCGPGKRVFMTAIDLENGKTIWETEEPVEGNGQRNNERKYMGSWSTPIITKKNGQHLIICSMLLRVNAYDPQTGKIIWSCLGLHGKKGDLAYTSPVLADEICVAMGGFNGPAISFRMQGTGDITAKEQLWRKEPNPQRISTGIYTQGSLFMANAGPNIFQCLNPSTGKILWQERSGGAACWGSLILANQHLYVTDQNGTTHVFKPNVKRLEKVAQNELRERSNSTPAFSNGQIFLRTFQHIYCIGN